MQTIIPYERDDYNKYRLILEMPVAVKRRVAAIKSELEGHFRGLTFPGALPSIYLAEFFQTDSKEQVLIDALTEITLGFMPFQLHINKLQSFSNKEIYLAIKEVAVIKDLIGRISEVNEKMEEAQFNHLPRISLTMHLQSWQFEKLESFIEDKRFSARFIADRMIVLKQMPGFRSWQIAVSLIFQNQLVLK